MDYKCSRWIHSQTWCKYLSSVKPNEVVFGPVFSYPEFLSKISYDHSILTIQSKVVSAYSTDPDIDVAKQCVCIVRESIEFKKNTNDNGDLFIIIGALIERYEKMHKLNRHIELLLKAFMPPCRDNYIAFESHMQNVIGLFDRMTGQLKYFLIRDMGGVYVHYETFKKSTGSMIDLDTLTNLDNSYYRSVPTT
ncbi:hypothetical protein BDA99DRAFT_560509 [Phascolomyces articulosus]|uniref:Uncharacterized protein n=1 Tax=Phascolomyces articulosus TaxID=60185 RepID=A0AAD5JZJ8_9FUNG|nr:hypothetical protein BDA99DRAFT_560509 [Phascolomyces articulosus]